jgi:arylsulfatase A-like enzyme
MSATTTPNNRNLIFITADQLRCDIISSGKYSKIVQTPNLKRLEKLGVTFRNHYTQTCPCGPARTSLHTSTYLFNHSNYDNGIPSSDSIVKNNWANIIKQNTNVQPHLLGYVDIPVDLTDELYKNNKLFHHWDGGYLPGLKRIDDVDYVGTKPFLKQHLNIENKEQDKLLSNENTKIQWNGYRGSMEWISRRNHTNYGNTKYTKPTLQHDATSSVAYIYTTRAIKFIDNEIYNNKSNFALHLSFLNPHPPFVVAPPYNTLYQPNKIKEFLFSQQDNVNIFKQHDFNLNQHPFIKKVNTTPNPHAHRHGASGYSGHVELNDKIIDVCNYFALITELDDNIGRLLDYLEVNDLINNTMIIFTCDHGEMLYDHDMIGKLGFFEESYHLPLIISCPSLYNEKGSGGGKVIENVFTESIDIAPTIVEWMCGGDKRVIPLQYDGKSLFPFLTSDNNNTTTTSWRKSVHYEYDFSYQLGLWSDENEFIKWTENHGIMKRSECVMTILKNHKYKLVYFANESIEPILFDMVNDPNETTNVAEKNIKILLKMIKEMLNWRIKYTNSTGSNNRQLNGMKIASDGVILELGSSKL